jgi:predicted transcriptional regulator
MRKELEIISDILGPNNKVIKTDIVYKKVFELDNIEVEQFISSKGTIVKKYCTVVSDNKFYKVNSPYEYVASLIQPIEVKGFYSKSNKYEKDKIIQSRRSRSR